MPPTFREYGAQVIRESLTKMLSHAESVRLADDIVAVHKMRVASRRLRAAIGVFAAAFPDPAFARFERDVKAVTDALGAARDLDVMIDTLEKIELSVAEHERGGVDRFIARRKQERGARQDEVRRALNRLEKRDLLQAFDEIVERSRPVFVPAGSEPELPFGNGPETVAGGSG
jgi:CHAD domain-containing protein